MRRAWSLAYTVWLSAAAVVTASEKNNISYDPQLGGDMGRLRPETSISNGAPEESSARILESSSEAPQTGRNDPQQSHYKSRYTFLQKFSRERYDHPDASSDDSTHDDASASEDTWSSMGEGQDEEAVTDVDRMCAPNQFLSPVGKSRGITDASDMMGAFKAFSRQKGNGNRKLLFFMTAGSGEELVGNRQISQRAVLRPTVRKKRAGFFNPSDGVGELSDDGRIQVEILHDMLRKFVASVKNLPPEKRKHACLDAFFVSTLQSGVETALEAFSGLLEGLACHTTAVSSLPQDGYLYSNVRLTVAPHLREVVEAEADVGEAFPTVLKKTKILRINNGFQRDIFDCTVANYGMQWRTQQLGASVEDELAALRGLPTRPDDDEAASEVLQVLDKFAYPKGMQGASRPEYIRAVFAFLKEAARQEVSAQRAAWAAPEEMEADSVESEASVLRRGLSFIRAICAMGDTTRYMVVSHPKLAERTTGHPMDNGELMAFSLDCGAVADCIERAGLTPSGTSSK